MKDISSFNAKRLICVDRGNVNDYLFNVMLEIFEYNPEIWGTFKQCLNITQTSPNETQLSVIYPQDNHSLFFYYYFKDVILKISVRFTYLKRKSFFDVKKINEVFK